MIKSAVLGMLFLLLVTAEIFGVTESIGERNFAVATLSVAGLAVAVYATLIFLVIAFRESVLWGLLCMLPFLSVVFLLAHWEEAKKPFFVAFVGWVAFLYGWF